MKKALLILALIGTAAHQPAEGHTEKSRLVADLCLGASLITIPITGHFWQTVLDDGFEPGSYLSLLECLGIHIKTYFTAHYHLLTREKAVIELIGCGYEADIRHSKLGMYQALRKLIPPTTFGGWMTYLTYVLVKRSLQD